MSRGVRILCLAVALLFIAALPGALSTAAQALPASEKNETVYATADAGGTVTSLLASITVSNPGKLGALTDSSLLKDIQTIGDTQPPRQENGSYVFRADGKDIAYQGVATGQLPVTMAVEYALDGKTIPPEQLAGASGRLKITVRFTNHLLQNVGIDGQTVALYTPFTAVSMLTLNDSCKNVVCENAKLMGGAGETAVTAFTFPGLAHDFDTDAAGKLADFFSVEADVTGFSFAGIKAVILTGLVDTSDLSDLNDFDKLSSGIDDLSSAGGKLSDAADGLYGGARKLQAGVGSYRDAAQELSAGMQKAVSANGQLVDGAASLQSGIGSLRTGIYSFSSTLNSGSTSGASASVDTSALQQQLAALNLSPEQMAGVSAIIQQTAQAASQQTAAAIVGKVQTGLTQLESAADQLQTGAASLSTGVRQANDGLVELGKGSATLASNGDTLVDGAQSLARGINKLRGGVDELNEDGIQKLADDTSGMRVGLSRRNAVVELGDAYQSFSGLSKGMTGTVRFVIDTAEISAQKPLAGATASTAQGASNSSTGQPARDGVKTGFFQRVWDWLRGAWDWLKRLFGA